MMKQVFRQRYVDCEITAPSEYRLTNIASPVIFCVDCVYRVNSNVGGNRCDEFIFCDTRQNITGIYIIEKKDSKNIDVTKVAEQLQGGACFITDFLDRDPALDVCRFDFMPILVSQGITPSQRRSLINMIISLRGINRHIQYVPNKKRLPKL